MQVTDGINHGADGLEVADGTPSHLPRQPATGGGRARFTIVCPLLLYRFQHLAVPQGAGGGRPNDLGPCMETSLLQCCQPCQPSAGSRRLSHAGSTLPGTSGALAGLGRLLLTCIPRAEGCILVTSAAPPCSAVPRLGRGSLAHSHTIRGSCLSHCCTPVLSCYLESFRVYKMELARRPARGASRIKGSGEQHQGGRRRCGGHKM